MAGRLMLLDSASLYFRAFFGVPDSLKAPDGTVVNAVRGLLDFVATLTTKFSGRMKEVELGAIIRLLEAHGYEVRKKGAR